MNRKLLCIWNNTKKNGFFFFIPHRFNSLIYTKILIRQFVAWQLNDMLSKLADEKLFKKKKSFMEICGKTHIWSKTKESKINHRPIFINNSEWFYYLCFGLVNRHYQKLKTKKKNSPFLDDNKNSISLRKPQIKN